MRLESAAQGIITWTPPPGLGSPEMNPSTVKLAKELDTARGSRGEERLRGTRTRQKVLGVDDEL